MVKKSRRAFLQTTAAVAAGIGARFPDAAAQSAVSMPTARATALMSAFGLKYPIFNAGMGTTAGPELAIAVSNAGQPLLPTYGGRK